ncbi:hypothetical protein C4J81_03070 [Deltaproteobacteria bacterium Smac51]|nr:hypothetical protein C4J81_03070 [Deltaproteobacteria bacterium Smac51]
METITIMEAAQICGRRVGAEIRERYLREQINGNFPHLGIYELKRVDWELTGVNKKRLLGFLSGRSHCRTTRELFNTDEM